LVPGLLPTPATDPVVERYRLFEAVRSWLAVTATPPPLLLVLDDLHWADAATVQLLGHLARVADPAPLRILGTLRDTEPGTEELRRLLDDVVPMSTTIVLGGLETSGVNRLVEAATGRSSMWDGTGLARQIQQETGGNPLFVAAVLAGLESGPTRSYAPRCAGRSARRGRLTTTVWWARRWKPSMRIASTSTWTSSPTTTARPRSPEVQPTEPCITPSRRPNGRRASTPARPPPSGTDGRSSCSTPIGTSTPMRTARSWSPWARPSSTPAISGGRRRRCGGPPWRQKPL